MQSKLDMENLSGNEYFLPIGSTKSVNDFIESAPEIDKVFQYLQNEFLESYGPNQCTIYGPMTTLSCVIGRELTKDERWEIATLGVKRSDWNPARGANVGTGVDVVRNWWNRKNPTNPIVTFLLVNSSYPRRKVLSKKYGYCSGFYGNSAYNADASDGVLDGNKFGVLTYGHCTCEIQTTVPDNYGNSYYRKDYQGCMKNKILHNTGYVFFLQNSLSDDTQRAVNAMKKGIWNGSDPDKIATRSQAVLMISRGIGKDVEWNKERPDDLISQSELNILCERAGITKIKGCKRKTIAIIFG